MKQAILRSRRVSASLAPLAYFYGAIVRGRAALYRRGFLRTEMVANAAVISIGNLTVGGTGKTPLVALVASLAAAEIAQPAERPPVCIISRGYGRKDVRRRVVVSDGRHLLADALSGGDEPRELAERLLGIAAVISDRDRVAAVRWACEHLSSRVFILDDGFQHLRLRRDLNVIVLDATDPWGGGKLLPGGRLREPPSALRRADLVVITRADQAPDIDKLKRDAHDLSGGRPVLTGRTRLQSARHLETSPRAAVAVSASPECRALAFCALGNPHQYFSALHRDGWQLTGTLAFPDHHRYGQKDADRISVAAREGNAELLLTTAKDAVKLNGLRWTLPCFVIESDLVIDDEATLRQFVREAVARGTTGAACHGAD